MKNILFKITLLFVSVATIGCSSSDDSSNSGNKSFTAKIDGENFAARGDLIFARSFGSQINIGGSNDNISNVKTIDFAIAPQEENLKLSNGLEITNTDDRFYVEANFVDFDEDIDAWEDEPGASYYIKIKSIDYSKNLISGEFKFTLVDDDKDLTIEITDGTFNNISF